ncbi:MAG TPA: helix-turn-helix domain-containing protein, partial [Bacteroidales bacterium]|nr:helix-turn-helix domain-containing protein [Bacteroidales bacterium]
LNTVPVSIPPLRERKEDILLLFRKFAVDFAEKYRMPPLELDDESKHMLLNFRWPGNIRQLRNLTEQISIIEHVRTISGAVMQKYIPETINRELPILYTGAKSGGEFSERELLYKVLFDMRRDINELKKLVGETVVHDNISAHLHSMANSGAESHPFTAPDRNIHTPQPFVVQNPIDEEELFSHSEVVDESLSIQEKEMDLIRRALDKHSGRRRNAAKELGISERTLYRKIKEYGINA